MKDVIGWMADTVWRGAYDGYPGDFGYGDI